MDYYNETSYSRSTVLSAVSRRSAMLREEEREDLANRIVGKVVKAWNDGQK